MFFFSFQKYILLILYNSNKVAAAVAARRNKQIK